MIYLLDEQKRYNSLNRKMISDIEEENKSLKSLLLEIQKPKSANVVPYPNDPIDA